MPTAIYQCDICGARFDNLAEAILCESAGVPSQFKVGDIIRRHDGYGWSTGPEHWIIREGKRFNGTPVHDFYWVVVAATGHDRFSNCRGLGWHHNRLILVSRGIVNGPVVVGSPEWGVSKQSVFAHEHIGTSAKLVENPPAQVRAEADEFLAQHVFVPGRSGNHFQVERIS